MRAPSVITWCQPDTHQVDFPYLSMNMCFDWPIAVTEFFLVADQHILHDGAILRRIITRFTTKVEQCMPSIGVISAN